MQFDPDTMNFPIDNLLRSLLYAEFQRIAAEPLPWVRLDGKTVFVTGAGGLLGSLIIKFLHFLKIEKHLQINILAGVRNLEKAKARLSGIPVEWVVGTLSNPISIKQSVDFCFHCAASTNSKEMIARPCELILEGVSGCGQLLHLFLQKKPESVVYLSSMEAYGVCNSAEPRKEECLGDVDLKNPRSCYPEGKRIAELFWNSACVEYDIPVKIARLAQCFGVGTPVEDPRVFGQFARAALAGEALVLHTEGRSIGNYCGTCDAVSALFYLLFFGENAEAYNVVNEKSTMPIYKMAELVARELGGGKCEVKIQMPSGSTGYAPDTCLHLSSEKLCRLGWKAFTGLADQFLEMAEYWKTEGSPSYGLCSH